MDCRDGKWYRFAGAADPLINRFVMGRTKEDLIMQRKRLTFRRKKFNLIFPNPGAVLFRKAC